MNTTLRKSYFKGSGMPLLNSGNWDRALHPRDSNGEFRYNGGRHRLKSGARGAADVVGTVLGGPYDPNVSAYTGKKIDPDALGAALPFKFPHIPGQLPGVYIKITSEKTGKSVIAPIVDLGPHKENNPYWDIPNGDPTSGDPQNHSGLDMTPVTARTLGLPVSRGRLGHAPAINTMGDEIFDCEFVPAPGTK
jgi:hypothetical protein